VPGCGDLLQIPFCLPDLVSSEKGKQRLARFIDRQPDSEKSLVTENHALMVVSAMAFLPLAGEGGKGAGRNDDNYG
jgi:hypothetical protein